jgi:MoxR-like ATPase
VAVHAKDPLSKGRQKMHDHAATSFDPSQITNAGIEIEQAIDLLTAAKSAIAQCIFGQELVIEHSLITLLAGGHGLIVGVPGLAKTRLVETLGHVLGLQTQRIQFTPDLMPSDILGSEVLDEDAERKRHFRFIKGPVFTQLLMADEINRASPRTQSALLQSMQEHHVTVAGHSHHLPRPFHVLATQNPFEQEGTYPLPEAQLDRFLLQIDVPYPDAETERRILIETTSGRDPHPKTVMHAGSLMAVQSLIRRMPVGDAIVNAILNLVRQARPGEGNPEINQHLVWGPGPRAGQAMMLAVRARALLQGRLAPSLDDVIALAQPVLKHRMALNYTARAEHMTLPLLIKHLTDRLS